MAFAAEQAEEHSHLHKDLAWCSKMQPCCEPRDGFLIQEESQLQSSAFHNRFLGVFYLLHLQFVQLKDLHEKVELSIELHE